jgi:hypothetical protein
MFHVKLSGSSRASSAGHLIRTAPASRKVLHRGDSLSVVPLATCTITPTHHIFTPIFLRFSPFAFSSAVGARQYLHDQSSSYM